MTNRPTLLPAVGDLNVLGAIRQACQDRFRVLEAAANADQATRLVIEEEPTLAIVDMALPGGSAARLIRELLEQHPTMLVVALLSEEDPEQVRAAVTAGARDYLAPPLGGAKISQVVDRVYSTREQRLVALEQARQRDEAGGIWSFASASGGCGQTTLLLSMAHELAAVGQTVAVVDLDWLFADVAFYLGIETKGPTVLELLQEVDPADPETLKSYMRAHATGIHVLPDPLRPTDAAALDPDAVQAVVMGLREIYDYVLVDLPVGLGDLQLPYLDASSFVFVTATGTIGALKNLHRMLDVLIEAGMKKGSLRPVLTAVHVKELDLTPFQRTLARLDTELSGVFPWDLEAAEDALHRGVPVSRLYPRSPFTKAVRSHLAPILERSRKAPPPEEKRGLLARLFG